MASLDMEPQNHGRGNTCSDEASGSLVGDEAVSACLGWFMVVAMARPQQCRQSTRVS